ncbi:MAG TPA: CHAT domain-containing protein [Pyrinomonadaceae bacterium]|nr:CHAT domain-containing protein [Pyrinomonadaceae bacterium]
MFFPLQAVWSAIARLKTPLLTAAIILFSAFCSQNCRHKTLEPVISAGDRVEGSILESNGSESESAVGAMSRWAFDGRAGEEITITEESCEFDAYLLLLDPARRQIARSDDNGGFFNALISTVLPATGRYTVIVCGANADQFGTYWLSLQEGISQTDWTQSRAQAYYDKSIEWAKRSNSDRAVAWVNLGMGHYFRIRRQPDKAEKYYAESIDHCGDTDKFVYIRWAVALERARMFVRLRSFDQALREFERAQELSKKLRASQEGETLILIGFGRLYSSMARSDLAEVYFRKALNQAEQGGRASTLVELYTSLKAAPQLRYKKQAIEYAEDANRLCSGLDPELELAAMDSLAGTYIFLTPERLQQGLELASLMRTRARETGCIDYEVSALALMSMGEHARNNIDEMIRLADSSLALTSPTDEDPNARRIALQLLADGEMARGNYQAALEWCLKALQTVERAWGKEVIEELRHDLLSQSKAICTQIIMQLHALNSRNPHAEYARQAFDYAERSRSRSLLEQLMQRDKRDSQLLDPQTLKQDQDLLDELSAVRGQLALLSASSTVSRQGLYRLREERARLIGEQMKFQAEIRKSASDTYGAAHLSPLTAEEVQKNLRNRFPNTAVLCYQLGIQKSFLIVLTENLCSLFELPDWAAISKDVSEWRLKISALQNSSEDVTQNSKEYDLIAHRLYNTLVKPAAGLIEGRDLIIVPSDALSAIGFEALVISDPSSGNSKGPKYLIEQHAVIYTSSLSALVGIENRRVRKPGARMLLIGDPSVNGDDTRFAGVGDRSFVATLEGIPAALKEILDISRIAKAKGIGVTAWIGSQGSESRLKGIDLSAFRYIHIAAHGISDSQDGAASALTLSPDSDGPEDGVLTGDEIAKLNLNADLVVLSACQTGTGQRTGAEGVVGLSRTFIIAGANCVCGSLWKVEDIWTQKLMSAFYVKLVAKGLSKPQALRLAKLDLIRNGANPSQWAPFVLDGSPR